MQGGNDNWNKNLLRGSDYFKWRLKRPWLYSTWDFRDSFHKLVFHVIWCENILKNPMGHISGVAEPFFSENQPNVMNLGFFCRFGKICCCCGLQIPTNTLGLIEKGVWRWTSWKISFFSIFDLFFDLFWRFFYYFKKIWDRVSEKKN